MSNLIFIRRSTSGYLPLTAAYAANLGETNTTILNALNAWETTYIANSLSGVITNYWPMLGSTATKNAYDFITGLSGTFNGVWTHSATGALPNGTNAYFNTGKNCNTLTTSNNHASFYSRTNTVASYLTSIGAYVAPNLFAIQIKDGTGTGLARGFNTNQSAGSGEVAIISNTNSEGFYLMNKTGTAIGNLTIDKNGSQIAANTVATSVNTLPNTNIIISALTSASSFDNKQCAGVTLGLGLTAGQRTLVASMVNTLNTSVGRNVY